jgi:enoyl-CoA hydratase
LGSPLTYALEDGIATIALDDGKANVMSVAMLRALDAALDRAAADKAVVVLRGRTGMFSAGFDLAVFKRDPQELFEMLSAGAAITERLLSFPHPVVAVCTGHAIAMGAFLLLSTDLRIGAHPDAKIQVNEVQIGLTLPEFAIEVCRSAFRRRTSILRRSPPPPTARLKRSLPDSWTRSPRRSRSPRC